MSAISGLVSSGFSAPTVSGYASAAPSLSSDTSSSNPSLTPVAATQTPDTGNPIYNTVAQANASTIRGANLDTVA